MNREETFFNLAVPPFFKDAALENCDKISPTLIEYGKQWALKPTSLLICGGLGNGKTTYSFALIREMLRAKKADLWPRFYTSPELDAMLCTSAKSDKGDSAEIRKIASEDLLFIDDLGRESRSDRLKRQYFELFNYRYTHKKPTIVTTNYNLDQIGEVINDAVASRMQQWQILVFTGPDLRTSNIIEG